MPYWSHEEENALRSMVEQGKPIEEICKVFHRSPEAIRLKIRRLGLEPPKTVRETESEKSYYKTHNNNTAHQNG
ncbi:hypothetical protein IBX35_02635 [Candidatus Bathyarchaeota archaeon]|nr:hypothetical protein [Candidatus Bathyarchaeota archaeon]